MKKLTKSRSSKILDGILGGIANYLNIDAMVIRILFLIFALFNPFLALLIYVILMFVIPVGDHFDEPTNATGRSLPINLLLGSLLILFGGHLLLKNIVGIDLFWFVREAGKYLWALVLIGIGVVIIYRGRNWR